MPLPLSNDEVLQKVRVGGQSREHHVQSRGLRSAFFPWVRGMPSASSRLLVAAHRSKATIDHRLVRETFSFMARKRWSFRPHYDIVRCRMYNILQGKRPGSDLVILDNEFSLASKQFWEFAIIESVSGKVLINTTIKHQERMDRDSPGQHPFITWMNQSSVSAVYSRSRIPGIGHMNVHEVSSKLQQVGITPDTVILVYHLSTMDLSLLREFLESAGYTGILPPDKNCIPLISLLRMNLSEGLRGRKLFSLRLEELFPIIYPRH